MERRGIPRGSQGWWVIIEGVMCAYQAVACNVLSCYLALPASPLASYLNCVVQIHRRSLLT